LDIGHVGHRPSFEHQPALRDGPLGSDACFHLLETDAGGNGITLAIPQQQRDRNGRESRRIGTASHAQMLQIAETRVANADGSTLQAQQNKLRIVPTVWWLVCRALVAAPQKTRSG
jgi:hypothetical protein